MSMFIKKVKAEKVHVEEEPRVYLFVPYEYKCQAKKLGAQWDFDKKKWFTVESNKKYQKLVDIFHEDNFYGTAYLDVCMKSTITTQKQRWADREDERQLYHKLYTEHGWNVSED